MAKCIVCDGPVSNGRCSICGMPYKRDENLYHLNEGRGDHYRHAGRSVRQKMVQQQLALPDQKNAAKTAQARVNMQKQSSSQYRAGVNTSRTNSTVRKTAANSSAYSRAYEKENKKSRRKKSGKLGWIYLLVLVLMLAGPSIKTRLDKMGGLQGLKFRIEYYFRNLGNEKAVSDEPAYREVTPLEKEDFKKNPELYQYTFTEEGEEHSYVVPDWGVLEISRPGEEELRQLLQDRTDPFVIEGDAENMYSDETPIIVLAVLKNGKGDLTYIRSSGERSTYTLDTNLKALLFQLPDENTMFTFKDQSVMQSVLELYEVNK